MSLSFLVIGEAMLDKVGDGFVTGGQASYSSRVAKSLGCKTSVLTAVGPDFDVEKRLPGIDVTAVPSANTTIHENIHIHKGGEDSRIWIQSSQSDEITKKHLLPKHLEVDIVQFGINSRTGVDLELVKEFNPEEHIVGLAPQGIYRTVGPDQKIIMERNKGEKEAMQGATVVFLGESDMIDDQMLRDAIKWSKILVITRGEHGCDVYQNSKKINIPVKPQVPVYETGAGDIFVAAYLVEFAKSGRDPIRSAEFANLVASHSILSDDIDMRPDIWRESPLAHRYDY